MKVSINHAEDGKVVGDQSLAVRSGEEDQFWFRSDRFFTVQGEWYFTTREQRDVGPFVSREDAEHGLALFIECRVKRSCSVDHAVAIAKQGDWAVVGFH